MIFRRYRDSLKFNRKLMRIDHSYSINKYFKAIMSKFGQRPQEEHKNKGRINVQLIGPGFAQYQHSPERYLLERINNHTPWPENKQNDVLNFLNSISALYNQVPYHNLTHAFDVMINLDAYLTTYGWQERLAISPQKRIFMLIAAYAHDGGHQGLTNAFYKNSNHVLATHSQSPLEYMHASHLRRLFREHKLEVPIHVLEELTEMILRTDNYYHGWLLQKGGKLQGQPDSVLRKQKNVLTICCLLLHAADLNNTAKQTEINIQWTSLLYQEFGTQNRLETERGLQVTVSNSVGSQRARSNLFFLSEMVLPLYRQIGELQPKFKALVERVERNKHYWSSLIK